jgi:hypothetical protein
MTFLILSRPIGSQAGGAAKDAGQLLQPKLR